MILKQGVGVGIPEGGTRTKTHGSGKKEGSLRRITQSGKSIFSPSKQNP